VVSRVVFDAVLEIPDGAADALAEAGEAIGAKDDDDDRQNDEQFW
jgi:hypothetical protein